MKKIHIIDNDPGMCQLLALAFRQAGHDVVTDGDPQVAKAGLARGECSALLMDFHLGLGESGAGVLQAWASVHDLPPTWMVTGTPHDPALEGLTGISNFQGVVAKPFSILDLVEQVLAALQASAPRSAVQELEA